MTFKQLRSLQAVAQSRSILGAAEAVNLTPPALVAQLRRAHLWSTKVLGNHPHVIIAPPDHPLAQQAKLPPETLLLQHFVMREAGSGTRILCDHYLDELGLARDVAVTEMESNETIKQAVISCLGIALLSGHTVIEELRSGRLVTLDAPNMPIL